MTDSEIVAAGTSMDDFDLVELATVEPLGSNGTLPPGIHDGTIGELETRFAGSERRRLLMESIRKLVHLARRSGFVLDIYIDGSFVTSKEDPNDVDIILGIEELPSHPDPLNVRERTLRLRSLRRCGGRDLHKFAFPVTDWRFHDLIEFFCKEREEAGGSAKGIVRLVGWRNEE